MAQTSRTLVGRDAELAELTGLLGERHVLLAGDAGVGKTRLLSELGEVARARGWAVHTGHCLDFGDLGLPYLPFSEILDCLAVTDAELVAGVELAHPTLARLRSASRSEVAPIDRAQLFAGVHALLAAAGAQTPTLVVLEDVHWADQSTRDLITFLLTRPFLSPTALVVSYRSDDLHRRHPLRRQSGEWARLPAVERIALEPLGDDAVRDLVAAIDAGLGESEREDIVARAEGNAFFVEELVGAATGPGHWMPEQLADLLLVRLDRLDDAGREIVRTASVAGRRVRHDLLAAVTDLPAAALDEALRRAIESHVLVAGDGAYWFRHALLAEAVYDDLLPGERVRLHARYAAALASPPAASGT
ncbi:MAG: AAA family ATPase, partial [Nocardioides sp.]|uniref:ATP-binding protein n=1 Tax=Nocardioides sp. TaxID=35761 RepID=UPI0039E66F54